MNALTNVDQAKQNSSPIQIKSKGELFKHLNSNVPLNEFHLPDFVYQADLIPEDLYSDKYSHRDRSNILQSATLQLTFEHNYPAILETIPFWEKWPAEPQAAYDAYLIYLELPEKSGHDNPIRLLPLIAEVSKIPLSTLTEYCHIYSWHWRARAYDLFLVAALRKQREQRIMTIEGKHFRLAEDQLAKIMQITNAKVEAIIAEMTSGEEVTDDTKLKDLFDIQEKLIRIQRMSIGLPAGNSVNVKIDDGPRHSTVNEQFKHVSKESTHEPTSSARSMELDALLENPEDLARLQDMMVRIAGHNIRSTPTTHQTHHTQRSADDDIIDVIPETPNAVGADSEDDDDF